MPVSHQLAELLTGLGSRLAAIPDWPNVSEVEKAAARHWAAQAGDLGYKAILLELKDSDAGYTAAVNGLKTQIQAIDTANKKISSIANGINSVATVLSDAEKVITAASSVIP